LNQFTDLWTSHPHQEKEPMSKVDRSEATRSPEPLDQNIDLSLESDQSLVTLSMRGNTAAFGLLAKRHRGRVLSLVLRITGNYDDAEDIVQQAFLKAFVNLKNYRGAAQFSTWLSRIAINEALMLKRRAKLRLHIPLSTSEDQVEAPVLPELRTTDPDPETVVSQQQWRSLLAAAIRELTPNSRIVLQVRDVQEHSIIETANILGLSIPAVKTRLARGRQVIRRKLERHWKSPSSRATDVVDQFIPPGY
jgi:RNA polymerase sigma-70 factor, ECF subfamily